MGDLLQLQCSINHDSGYSNVTWYWTRCVHNAGVNGTAILPADTSDAYGVYHLPFSTTHTIMIFLVTNATLGYYWCEINSTENSSPLRSSVITPVLQPTNASLPRCTITSIQFIHNFRSGPECAAEGSPIIYPRAPLPSFCPKASVRNIITFVPHLCINLVPQNAPPTHPSLCPSVRNIT